MGSGVPLVVAPASSPNVAFVVHVHGEREAMESTVVRCAEGHVFSTSTFPMQNLGSGRIGPGRLLRCPRCARLRHAVPVGEQKR
ncbi:hypothetical protein GCM10027091_04690 [Streptomyces daliensis]